MPRHAPMKLAPAPESAGLSLLGALVEAGETILLLGPQEPGFWAIFTASAEYADGQADPLDRWSRRVIRELARAWGGRAVLPSEGPPWPPFTRWARESGQIHVSPVGLLVRAGTGLWLSFRGAVVLPGARPLPSPEPSPCDACARPCLVACPAGALGAEGYDTDACHAWLDTPAGEDCLQKGCAVRRACPAGSGHGRLDAQSAFHMRAFHPK